MSFLADVNLRQLVEEVSSLAQRPAKEEHLLGRGIPRRREYRHPEGRLLLPGVDEGLQNLRAALESQVHNLSDEMSNLAWGQLLGKPKFVVPLKSPTEDELQASGIALSDDSQNRLVRLGLVATISLPEEGFAGGQLTDGRLAGVGVLTLQRSREPRASPDDGWLDTIWTSTTSGLSAELERLLPRMASASNHRIAHRPVLIVLGPRWSGRLDDMTVADLEISAHIFGLRATVLNGGAGNFGNLQNVVTQTLPYHLVFAGGGAENLRLTKLFRETGGVGQVVSVEFAHERDILGRFRECFAALAGISAGLMPLAANVPEPEPTLREGEWEILCKVFDKCYHDTSHRRYRREAGTDTWWTKDTAKHGQSAFKSYESSGGKLLHRNDHNASGAVINKWKGPGGREIEFSDLLGCDVEHSD